MNLQMVNAIFECFLFYLIRKYVGYNFSYVALVLYICTLKQVKKDHFTIILSSHDNICIICIMITLTS